ncbi:MAG: hypothetical protein ABSA53_20420 [Streptosporangiaceae bacterium]|jgi:hypothetical protein
MEFGHLSVRERAALFALLAEARPLSNPELEERVGFRLDGAACRKLNQIKLVKTIQPNRAFVHELTDAGWRWCADELTAPRHPDAKSIESALYAVLAVFGRYIQATGLSLADVVKTSLEPASQAPQESADIEARVMSAYRVLAKEPAQFVKLTELRSRLADSPRSDIDAALDRMYRSQRINLIPQSSPRALSAEDREAAICIGGQDKHLMSEVLR